MEHATKEGWASVDAEQNDFRTESIHFCGASGSLSISSKGIVLPTPAVLKMTFGFLVRFSTASNGTSTWCVKRNSISESAAESMGRKQLKSGGVLVTKFEQVAFNGKWKPQETMRWAAGWTHIRRGNQITKPCGRTWTRTIRIHHHCLCIWLNSRFRFFQLLSPTIPGNFIFIHPSRTCFKAGWKKQGGPFDKAGQGLKKKKIKKKSKQKLKCLIHSTWSCV